MKYIVTSGCSFTRQFRRIGITGTADDFQTDAVSQWKWPHFIEKEYKNDKVLNYGCPTNDNAIIVDSIIYGVSKLLKDNVKPEDIKVIVQWSGWSRSSFFISKEKQDSNGYKLKNRYDHINDFIDNKPILK
jgi:hypothetical protein